MCKTAGENYRGVGGRAQFARRFAPDSRVLQDWDQGRQWPDRAARAYLIVIAGHPGR